MADRRRDSHPPGHRGEISRRDDRSWSDYQRIAPLVASSQILPHADQRYGITATQYETWQAEAWLFYENLGEFNYGVEWFSEALSRVRLVAAELVSGGDEPTPLDSGAAVDLIEGLAGGTDAQAQLLRSFATQLSVVGESFLVGREVTEAEVYGDTVLDADPDENGRVWTVQPVNTLRRSHRTVQSILGRQRRGWELQTDETTWLPLPRESLITRVWNRSERVPWLAMSPARAALPVMREIDMYNRYIMATLVSRVALNGLLLIPDNVTLPVNPEYEDETEPFMSELLDIMTAAIKNPGSPASAAPLPLRVPPESVDKFKHLTFATPLDEKIFQARDEALRRLAASLNLPQEVLTGMGATNHWSSWQLEESAIKIHVSPAVEVITSCLTRGYLRPMLRAMNENLRGPGGGLIVIWYDTSTLTQRPDRSDLAIRLNDMMVINDSATRRETGFSEDDKPSDDELETMVLRKLAVNPQTYAPALRELTGLELAGQPAGSTGETAPGDLTPDSGPEGEGSPGAGDETTRDAPDTRDESPPPPGDDTPGVTAGGTRRTELLRRVREASTQDARISAVATLVTHSRGPE